MIEKLDIKNYENKQQLVWFGIINKLNELCDIINAIIIDVDGTKCVDGSKAPADNSEKANCQGSVLTMVDNQVTANLPNIDAGELAFLSKENSNLKDELITTRKALDKAVWWLNEIVKNHRFTPISTAEMALKEITALEQKEAK